MFTITLALHNLLRWAVLFFGVMAIVRGLQGGAGRPGLGAARLYAIVFDIQVLIGLLLYVWLSPITTSVLFGGAEGAMRTRVLRFWTVEHAVLMILALALAHIGVARARKAPTDAASNRAALTFCGLSLIFVILGMPWPWGSVPRPWMPGTW